VGDERRVERTILLPASPADVWEALLDEEQLATWFGDLEIDPQFGGAVTFTENDGSQRRGIVETIEPEHRLAFRWWGEGDGSRVELVVEEESEGTRLTVVETEMRVGRSGAPRALAMAG
jgi:uncharacterized protein YndB with AHSA1/START domain